VAQESSAKEVAGQAEKAEDKEVVQETLEAPKTMKIYVEKVSRMAAESFDKAIELYSELAKVYGPRISSSTRYGIEQFKKHGSHFLQVASENVAYYGHIAAAEGLKLTTKAIDFSIELANKAIDAANDRFDNYRKKSSSSKQ
jgi:hypothetical protein